MISVGISSEHPGRHGTTTRMADLILRPSALEVVSRCPNCLVGGGRSIPSGGSQPQQLEERTGRGIVNLLKLSGVTSMSGVAAT